MQERTCVQCARPFLSEHWKRRRCYECYPKWQPPCPCSACGKTINGSGTSLPPGQRTCQACRGGTPRKPAAHPRPPRCVDCGGDKRVNALRCPACAKAKKTQRQRKRTKAPDTRMQPPRPCDYCGETYTCRRQSRTVKFCSRACMGAANRKRPVRLPECPLSWASCLHCREVFSARRGRLQHTDRCSHKLRYVNKPARCFACGAGGPVLKRQGIWSCPSCKAAAKKRQAAYRAGTNNFRKRARHHGVAYEPINKNEIFERDRGVCYLCGVQTVLTPEHHPSKATLDHVIPMSRGGPHLKHNVRCACWECNTLKGARTPWEFWSDQQGGDPSPAGAHQPSLFDAAAA